MINDPINRPSWENVDPDFDGHLSQPLEKMSVAERLRWAWEGTLLLHWARQAKLEPPVHRSPQRPPDS